MTEKVLLIASLSPDMQTQDKDFLLLLLHFFPCKHDPYINCTYGSRKLGSSGIREFTHAQKTTNHIHGYVEYQQKQNRLRHTLVKANTPQNWHLGFLVHMHFWSNLKAFFGVQKGGYLLVHQESFIIDFWQLPPSVYPRNPIVFLDTRTYYWSCEEFLIRKKNKCFKRIASY